MSSLYHLRRMASNIRHPMFRSSFLCFCACVYGRYRTGFGSGPDREASGPQCLLERPYVYPSSQHNEGLPQESRTRSRHTYNLRKLYNPPAIPMIQSFRSLETYTQFLQQGCHEDAFQFLEVSRQSGTTFVHKRWAPYCQRVFIYWMVPLI